MCICCSFRSAATRARPDARHRPALRPYFNPRHERSGTLPEGRFRSCIAESALYCSPAIATSAQPRAREDGRSLGRLPVVQLCRESRGARDAFSSRCAPNSCWAPWKLQAAAAYYRALFDEGYETPYLLGHWRRARIPATPWRASSSKTCPGPQGGTGPGSRSPQQFDPTPNSKRVRTLTLN